jgi:hypothetical protein
LGSEEVEAWRSCFFHDELTVFLVVYVDDFKAAETCDAMKSGI